MTASTYLEDLDSKLPAVQLLCALGWTYLPRAEALRLRNNRRDHVVLTGILAPWLKANNQFQTKGKLHTFDNNHVAEAVRRLTDPPVDGLVRANEHVYHLLMLGTSIDVTVDDDRKGRTLHYFDKRSDGSPDRNVYHVTDEFAVERSKSHDTCRPDLVLFINGIPVAVIECKRRDGDRANAKAIDRAIGQVLDYQQADAIPKLFHYAQLLFGTSVNACRYGTTGSDRKFWSAWREEGAGDEPVHKAINTSLDPAIAAHVMADPGFVVATAVDAAQEDWRQQTEHERLPTEQDRTLWAMLRPPRLVEFICDGVVFDAGIRKVARHQQWFAVKATADRVSHLHAGRRAGGVIWHTTGSGKSLTMVMLAKAIATHPAIANPCVVLVTDREQLDSQLSLTFGACGKDVKRAKTGEHLGQLIADKATIISTIINKFAAVMAQGALADDSANVFVLVDEGHRSNYGTFAAQMRTVFSHACYIGFTGTPLTLREKQTANRFGGFIHSYTMRQAVADEAVVPLVYEGRMALLEQNARVIEGWFDRLTVNLKAEHKIELKRLVVRRDVILSATDRQRLIAHDVSDHFVKNFAGVGLKGQLAASTRTAAIRYREHLNEIGKIRAEVIMSKPELHGYLDSVDEEPGEVEAFWAEMMTRYGTEKKYNDEILASFAREDGVQLLVVVDKLLTGFDEPRNTVLYIDKSLREHNILQAIARVNRLFPGKDRGVVVDYRGVLGELNDAMKTYDALAGFDHDDVDLTGAVVDIAQVLRDLPQHHTALWSVFKEVANQADNEAMERHLAPEDRREGFYAALRQYLRTLGAALASERLYEAVATDLIDTYKRDGKRFASLRASVSSRYSDAVDLEAHTRQLRKLLDTHLQATEVSVITEEVSIFDDAAFAAEVERHKSSSSKADTIASRLSKTCRDKTELDPVFYGRFSELVQKLIDDYRQGRIDELAYLQQIEALLATVRQGHEHGVPATLHGAEHSEARAFFGLLREKLPASDAALQGGLALDAALALDLEIAVAKYKVRDWPHRPDAVKDLENGVDDFLFDARANHQLAWTTADIDDLLQRIVAVLKKGAPSA